MDGGLVATIVGSGVAVASSIGVGFWRLGRAIGRLEGRMDGVDKQIDTFSKTVSGLDSRINGLVNNPSRKKLRK